MKILQLVPYFPPYLGGQENYVLNLSRHLVKRGHEVHVVTSNFPLGKKYEEVDGITVERHHCLARPLRNPIVPGFFKLFKNSTKFDIIHTHNEHSTAAVVAMLLGKYLEIPLVLTCHGQLDLGNLLYNRFEERYNNCLGKYIFNQANSIISLSNNDKNYIASLGVYNEKIKVLPNAIDINEFERFKGNEQNLEEIRSRYNLNGKIIVLYSGQIVERKGLVYLIKAIPYILKNCEPKEVIFIITGDGRSLSKVQAIAKNLRLENNLIFTRFLRKEDLIYLYQISDIFVLPSLSEGLPTSILEAMYFGLPIIATNIPSIAEYIKNISILIPPRDEMALAKAITEMINEDSLRQKLSKAGKKFVENKYNWPFIAEKYETIYNESIYRF